MPPSYEYQAPSTQNSTQSTQGNNRKSPNWKINEDVALCESWIRVSEDPIVGNGQAHDAFWLSIWNEFKERVLGTERTQRACENRWALIQADVSKWRAIVRRVQRKRFSTTNPNDEWGACFIVFKKDHGKEFKFMHCWEVLRFCTKWQLSTDEKDARDASKVGKSGGVGTSQSKNTIPPWHVPSFTNFESSSPGLHSFDDSCNDHEIDIPLIGTPTSGLNDNVAQNNPPPTILPNPPVQRPLGRKSAKEKRRQTITGNSQTSSAASEQLHATVSAWRQSSETRFESLKQTVEE
ncbi:uncharacterized protein LOC119995968 [Tripterygium wilfordii]|uniref:uncharacterized protein LOC119995968 n=1 Tax=Tripterygium wilfordii TaxID=458696 RepID=UPI0018F8444A|nr:uncharacterized protein LOC119995968 [Tripterygium wilfordii]XP_038698380.1 uncharacterized protein LOC119995968 [Tripterygium wilfordii]